MPHKKIEQLIYDNNLDILMIPYYRERFFKFVEQLAEILKQENQNESD